MSDRLKAKLIIEADRVEVPYADLGAIVKAGRGRLLRRRATATTALAVAGLALFAASRSLDLKAFSSEVAPAATPSTSGPTIPPELADDLAALREEQRLLTAALNRGDFEHVQELGKERLSEAKDPDDWDYGNAIHIGHLILGQAELRSGNPAAAERHLLAAADTPGSPQLDSSGPNMSLARDLLLMGRRQAVIEYLTRLGEMWPDPNGRLPIWKRYVRAGAMPDFGANLVYGGLEVAPIKQLGICTGCRLPPPNE